MLARECRSGTEKAGLRVGDQFDRDRRHEILEPPLGDEALGETRPDELVADTQAKPPRDHDAAGALCKRKVACNAAERETEAIRSRSRQRILAAHRRCPYRAVIERSDRASFHARQRFINIDDAGTGYDTLYRHAAMAFAQPREDGVLDAVERREIDMSAFGRLDAIVGPIAPYMRDAKPGPGADNADRSLRGKWLVRACQPLEILRLGLRDRMTDSLEIIDQRIAVDIQLLADQRRANDPGIVGEANDLATRRPRDRNGDGARSAPPCRRSKSCQAV